MTLGGPDSVALVTGGSRGIGRAVAVRLAAAGVGTVIINYLQNDAQAATTQKEIETHKARAVLVKANLSSLDEIDRLFSQVRTTPGRLQYLVHCAGLAAFKPLIETRANQWDLTININARAFLACAQLAAPLMPGGAMVALSSLGSTRVVPHYGAMGPAKAALEAIVRQLAVELAPQGIRVNAVVGGLVATDSLQKFPNAGALVAQTVERTPARRLGTTDEIADAVLLLLSTEARWICGQSIVADGGFSLE